jgi:transcriptional regulator with XRE-family HTH domain
MEFGIAFGQVLKAHRTEAGLSQEELAFRANMHSTTISLYERGERRPSLQTVFIIAGALGLRPEYMVMELGKLKPDLG